MRIWFAVAIVLMLAPSSPSLAQPPSGPQTQPRMLEPGDSAPDFSMVGSDGRTYKLSDYRGKQVVVLAWFARAFSQG